MIDLALWIIANPLLGAFSGYCLGRAVVAILTDVL
jgi:hypothetical protein